MRADLQPPDPDPVEQLLEEASLLRLLAQEVEREQGGECECDAYGCARHEAGSLSEPPADEEVDDGRSQRQREEQPKLLLHTAPGRRFHQPASPRAWSTSTVPRRRYTATMIARPTTTSAAATTIEKNASTWPSSATCIRENA